jgi:hypothetical protein
MLDPYPPVLQKKRLEGVENKGSGVENAKKRGCILLKTLRGSLQRECKRRHLGRLRRESRGWRAGRARNGIQDGNLMTGLLQRSWIILLVGYIKYKRY